MKLRPLTLGEMLALLKCSMQIRETVSTDLADLVDRIIKGDDTALIPMIDLLAELDRPELSARLKKLVME